MADKNLVNDVINKGTMLVLPRLVLLGLYM